MSKHRKLLVIDTETGGFDPEKVSILSVAAVVVNQGAIEGEFYTLVAEHEIIVEQQALDKNKLTVEMIRSRGMSPYAACQAVEQFLLKHDMRGKVSLAGCNVAFDVGFLKRLYRLSGWWKYEDYFSHRTLCVQTGALLLEQAGLLDLPGGSASLEHLCLKFGIPLDRLGGHNALSDARATALVLRKLIEKIR